MKSGHTKPACAPKRASSTNEQHMGAACMTTWQDAAHQGPHGRSPSSRQEARLAAWARVVCSSSSAFLRSSFSCCTLVCCDAEGGQQGRSFVMCRMFHAELGCATAWGNMCANVLGRGWGPGSATRGAALWCSQAAAAQDSTSFLVAVSEDAKPYVVLELLLSVLLLVHHPVCARHGERSKRGVSGQGTRGSGRAWLLCCHWTITQ